VPSNRRTFIRLAALAGATTPWTLGALTPAVAGPLPMTDVTPTGPTSPSSPPYPSPSPPNPNPNPALTPASSSATAGPAPVIVPGRDPSAPGRLVAGDTAGLLVGYWNDSPYSATGGVWYRGTVRYLDGSQPVAVNGAGVVIGDAVSHYDRQAFRWFNGTYRRLGFLGGTNSQGGHRSSALAVSPTGTVVGWSTTDSGASHAVLWSGSRPQDLGTLGGSSSVATAVNAAGRIVGAADTADGRTHAVVWSGGTIRDLGGLGGRTSTAAGINAGGQIVGTSETAAGANHAVLWDRGRTLDLGTLPGATDSEAIAINSAGQVLVRASLPGSTGAFVWQAGRRVRIGSPGDVVEVAGINDQGTVCGTLSTAEAGGGTQAFRWQAGRLTRLGSLGGRFGDAAGITPTGIVLGAVTTGAAPAPQAAFWPAPGGSAGRP
jgi:probable HAF family extracellular repeat protein